MTQTNQLFEQTYQQLITDFLEALKASGRVRRHDGCVCNGGCLFVRDGGGRVITWLPCPVCSRRDE
jgi:hypothetical protein